MKRQYFFSMLLAVLAWASTGIFSPYAMAQGRWGFGLGPTASTLYSDLKKTSVGVGAAGYVTRRLNSHLGLTGIVSYDQLPFSRVLPITTPPTTVKLTTKALRGDLLFDYELSSGNVRPYIGVGLGGTNYRASGKVKGTTIKSPKSLTTFDFGPNLGFRAMLSPRVALDLGGSFRLTTTDNLDGTATNKAKDAIISGMVGFTFFGGSRGTDMLAEQTPFEESSASTDDMSDFQQRIDQMESAATQEPPQDMQEYIKLKSRKDDLDQQIVQKENEINSLRTTLTEKDQNVNAMQTQLTAAPATSASFSRGYEEALSKFYSKRYNEAIEQFNGLVAQFPDHPRVSNCVYWVGEAYFGAGNYQEAANTFTRVLDYPRSLKRDDALLMLGRAYAQLNQKDSAREAFNRLLTEFPSSEFAAKAQEWLNKI
ncbi:MAG: Outer membrane protein assembly factor BamD [bacterium]|nr:Outer membrane protein assembly factor BamD [bacterium]